MYKKIISLIMSGTIALGIVGCSNPKYLEKTSITKQDQQLKSKEENLSEKVENKDKLTVEEGLNKAHKYIMNNIGKDITEIYEITAQGPDDICMDLLLYDTFIGTLSMDLNSGEIVYESKYTIKELDEIRNTKNEIKTGQCYDCGEYYPVTTMKSNGRSYHCGCYAGQCENCGSSVFYEGYTIADEKFRVHQSNGYNLCSECYEIEQLELYGPKCDWCKVEIPVDCKSYTDNGEILCSNCYIQYHDTIELNKIWICSTCGRENQGEVLCECEFEALN